MKMTDDEFNRYWTALCEDEKMLRHLQQKLPEICPFDQTGGFQLHGKYVGARFRLPDNRILKITIEIEAE